MAWIDISQDSCAGSMVDEQTKSLYICHDALLFVLIPGFCCGIIDYNIDLTIEHRLAKDGD